MAGGKAHGRDRQYQLQCRDVLVFEHPGLRPYADDGIDVAFDCGGTTWTLDVALRASTGDVVVAECRRREDPVEQGDIAEFAYKVELLRKALAVPVAGVFFAKHDYRSGAVKVGAFEGVTIALQGEGQAPPGFGIAFYRYDRERERKCRDIILHAPSGHYGMTGGSVEFKVVCVTPSDEAT